MKEFRVVRITNLPYKPFKKRDEGKWLDARTFTIKEMNNIQINNDRSLERGIISDWYLEYR